MKSTSRAVILFQLGRGWKERLASYTEAIPVPLYVYLSLTTKVVNPSDPLTMKAFE